MLTAIAFYTLAAFILGFAVLVVTSRDSVHSVLFLIGNLLCVAMLYVLLRAEFLAVIQVLVYAGGIVVLYLFVVMLVNLKRPPEQHVAPQRLGRSAFLLAGAVLAEFVAILVFGLSRGDLAAPAAGGAAGRAAGTAGMGNVQQVGLLLYTDYLVPFEVASMLLLVAMIGAIVLAKREL
ncbi:MAG TPA: NADH-quinone oxidoreductase subunit J [Vicinamibacterales bacterium]|nr:NADH-quinone oxidoreductase subunit J [Vicinamibacterales bacterium]